MILGYVLAGTGSGRTSCCGRRRYTARLLTDRDREAWRPSRPVARRSPGRRRQARRLPVLHRHRPRVGHGTGTFLSPQRLQPRRRRRCRRSSRSSSWRPTTRRNGRPVSPGGHLMTIDHWRTPQGQWRVSAAQPGLLAISAAFADQHGHPLRHRIGMSKPWQLLQQNLTAWFYTATHWPRIPHDLNSGRRVSASLSGADPAPRGGRAPRRSWTHSRARKETVSSDASAPLPRGADADQDPADSLLVRPGWAGK